MRCVSGYMVGGFAVWVFSDFNGAALLNLRLLAYLGVIEWLHNL